MQSFLQHVNEHFFSKIVVYRRSKDSFKYVYPKTLNLLENFSKNPTENPFLRSRENIM